MQHERSDIFNLVLARVWQDRNVFEFTGKNHIYLSEDKFAVKCQNIFTL
jgi:hypothetical protein